MAIAVPSPIMPRSDPAAQKREKPSAVDQILQGLSIANGILGIGANIQTIRAHQSNIEKTDFETDQEKQAAERQLAGTVLPTEAAKMQTTNQVSHSPIADAVKMQQLDGSPLYIAAKAGKAEPPATKVVGQTLLQQDPTTGAWKPAYSAPEKPQLAEVMTVDANGNPVTKFVPKESGAAYARPDKPEKAPDYGKVYSDMVTHVETPRGNQAVQQASNALRSVGVASELINQYPNTNDMPPDKVALLNQEISKVASGGVGSEHGQKSLEANTFAEKWAKFTQQVGNEPSGAQLGAFIQQNKDYLEGVAKVNQNVVNKYQLNIYKGYRGRLTPEQDQQFQQDYPHLFQAKDTSQIVATPTPGGSGTAQAAPMPKPGEVVDGYRFKGGDPGQKSSWEKN